MPIKPSAVLDGGEQEPKPPAGAPEAGEQAEAPPAKRRRRSKAEILADTVVPGEDDLVQVKFISTGTKGERPWLVAVELYREDKIEFVPKELKYAVEKMDQQKGAAPAAKPDDGPGKADDPKEEIEGLTARWSGLQTRIDALDPGSQDAAVLAEEAEIVRGQIMELGGTDPASDAGYEQRTRRGEVGKDVPPDAQVGDEVIIGLETYRVGHGNVLVQGQVGTSEGEIIHPQRRWKHVLGTGGKEWESQALSARSEKPSPLAVTGGQEMTIEREVVERSAAPSGVTVDGLGVWKVTMGYKEKIGLPDYSNIEIGPASAQHQVVDDGRRVTMTREDGSTVELPAAAVEGMAKCAQVCEYVMRAERTAMINFLEAVKPGSTRPTQG